VGGEFQSDCIDMILVDGLCRICFTGSLLMGSCDPSGTLTLTFVHPFDEVN